MAKPTYLPIFATNSFALPVSGQQNKVRPPAQWQTDGWAENEEPPCNYENWLKNNNYEWLKYWNDNAVFPCTRFVAADDATARSKENADQICDADTDETQLQAAIDAVSSAGGGTVMLSEGTFILTAAGLNLKTKVSLKGQGPGTVIKIDGSTAASFELITIANYVDMLIADLVLDGNRAAVGSYGHNGIKTTATVTSLMVRNVIIRKMKAATGYGYGLWSAGGTSRCTVSDCFFEDCADVQIKFDSGADRNLVRGCHCVLGDTAGMLITSGAQNIVEACHFYQNAGHGVSLTGPRNIVRGCVITESGVNGMYVSLAGDFSLIDGCLIYKNDEHGIELDAPDNCRVLNCEIRENSQDTDDTGSGIYAKGGSNSAIRNCTIRHGGGAKQHKYGVDCDVGGTPPTGLLLSGNDCRSSGKTGSINASGGAAGDVITVPEYSWNGAAHVQNAHNVSNRV